MFPFRTVIPGAHGFRRGVVAGGSYTSVTIEAQTARFDQLRNEISVEQRAIVRLETRIASSESGVASVLIARRDLVRNQVFKTILTFAHEVDTAR